MHLLVQISGATEAGYANRTWESEEHGGPVGLAEKFPGYNLDTSRTESDGLPAGHPVSIRPRL